MARRRCEVDLWWIGPGTRWGDAGCLSPDEHARAGLMPDQAIRADFVRHRAALRSVLAQYAGAAPGDLRFAYGPAGKPRLDGPADDPERRPAFSLSHAGSWAVIAVGFCEPLGVDVERMGQRTDFAGPARRFLPELNLDGLPPEEREAAFFAAWTRYEAFLKAAGNGLGQPLPPSSRTWVSRPLLAPRGHVATLVTGRPVTALRCRQAARDAERMAAGRV